MPPSDANRRGTVLLEVVVALGVLTVAGLAMVGAVRQSDDAARRAEAVDDDVRRASAFLDAIALWTREDLDRHLGDRVEGPWRLSIRRPTNALYVVVLSDTGSDRALVSTDLYRPGSAHDEP